MVGLFSSLIATSYCTNTTTLTGATGTVSDGSGTSDYFNNTNCSWLIKPTSAAYISLNFSEFDTESGWDYVTLYDGSTTNAPILGVFTGSNIPQGPILSSGGSLLLDFNSDEIIRGQGWKASYTSSTTPPFCTGTKTLTTSSSNFNDGSFGSNYLPNSNCGWLIQPTQAIQNIELNFLSFDTQPSNDFVKIYDGNSAASPLLASFSGNNLPTTVKSTGSKMFVNFVSNSSDSRGGFTASYKSSFCGTTTLAGISGTFNDGSGISNYALISTCYWLLSITAGNFLKLTFDDVDLEYGWDFITVYEGSTEAGPILAQITGTQIPSDLYASGKTMLVKFVSNSSVESGGFQASYSASFDDCLPVLKVLRTVSGVLSDGSGSSPYKSNLNCQWLIYNTDGKFPVIDFSAFNLVNSGDKLIFRNGYMSSDPVFASFTGAIFHPCLLVRVH